MGFPVCYSELPKIMLHLLFILAHLRRLIKWSFHSLGLSSPLEYETQSHDTVIHGHYHHEQQKLGMSISAETIQESFPVSQYGDLFISGGSNSRGVTESCAVCLYEFEAADKVRRMSNCGHVFHRHCVDQWLEYDKYTCPLCRTPLICEELQHRDWAISGVDGMSYAGEYHYSQLQSL